MSDDQEVEDRAEILEWFTIARKIPELIGKLPSGERIKGGPYRPIQLVMGGAVLAVGHLTMRWWSFVGGDGLYGLGVRYIVVATLAVGAVFAGRAIPLTVINPLIVAEGGGRMLLRRNTSTWAGQPVTIPQPHQAKPPHAMYHPTPSGEHVTTPAAAENHSRRPATTRVSPAAAKMAELARRSHA